MGLQGKNIVDPNRSEEMRVALGAIKDNLAHNYTNQMEQKQILDVVDRFRGEYSSYFEGGNLTANVTQMLWHRLHLCKRRMAGLGLSMG